MLDKIKINSITAIVFCMITLNSHAQTDTVGKGKNRLLNETVKPGLRQYIIYMQDPSKPKVVSFWYWSRNIRLEMRGGQQVITNTQTWLGNDTTTYRKIYSVNRASDFLPVYHSETIGGKVKAYNWTDLKISGADTVAGNEASAYDLEFKNPVYNWNLDVETFEQLPLAANKVFVINFYDAGRGKPQYREYRVSGSEVLKSYNNQKIDCWILSTEGKTPNSGKYSERFWISKKGHEFIKEQDTYPGGYRYKIKMSEFMPDILKTFSR